METNYIKMVIKILKWYVCDMVIFLFVFKVKIYNRSSGRSSNSHNFEVVMSINDILRYLLQL